MIKGVCLLGDVSVDSANPGQFVAYGDLVGTDAANPVQTRFTVPNLSPAILSSTMQSAIQSACKDILINTYGYTFGLLDSVRLVTALV